MASVVSNREATEAPFYNAHLSTFVGAVIPNCIMSPYPLRKASYPKFLSLLSMIF